MWVVGAAAAFGLVLACGSGGGARSDGGADVAVGAGGSGGGQGGAAGAGGAAGVDGGAGGSVGAGGASGAGGALIADVSVTVDATQRKQTMVGFGGAVVYYASYLSQRNVANDDLPSVLFSDLGLDVLRIGNWYQNQAATGTSTSTPFSDTDIVAVVEKATQALGHAPKILMSSWSPPAYLKSNASTMGMGGTLATGGTGFPYGPFAQWWVNALGAYAAKGVHPDFISLQNEPDFSSNYETCLFDPTEGLHAGYPQALDALRTALAASSLSPKPEIWGPEPIGIGYNDVQGYLDGIRNAGVAAVDGIAHHLYHGGESGDDPAPDSFTDAMTGVAAAAASAGKPLYMTEFQANVPSLLNTAWMIHNAVTVEGVSAYIYWPLFWISSAGPPLPPVSVEDPTAPFTTAKGYTVNDVYYALKHFARWVDSGWVRLVASASATNVKASAFTSPDGGSLTVVLINTDSAAHVVGVSAPGFSGTAGAYRTSGTSERTAPVSVGSDHAFAMPAGSIVTFTLTP
jgi:glucuronoarabinoxylan endo-1,4-beta-xylanase